MRSLFASLPPKLLRSLVLTSTVEDVLASKRYSHFRGNLFQPVARPNMQGAWICQSSIKKSQNPASSDIVIIYFHGGGYVFGQISMFTTFLLQMAENIEAAGKTVSIFALEYPLAPETPFPGALLSAIAAYQYICTEIGADSSKIVLMGDSAGGNLCLSLLRYLLKQHDARLPGSKDLFTQSGGTHLPNKIAALVLISPWLSLNNKHSSFSRHAHSDVFDKKTLDQWASFYRTRKVQSERNLSWEYTEFTGATNIPFSSPQWLEQLCRNVHLTAGADELFVGDIVDFAESLRRSTHINTTVDVEDGREHDWQMADIQAHQAEFLSYEIGDQRARKLLMVTNRITRSILKAFM